MYCIIIFIKLMVILCVAGGDFGGYHKRHPKQKTIIVELPAGNAEADLEQPASETYRQSCYEVSRVTKGCFEAHFEHSH